MWDCRWPENCGYQCVASYSLAAILSSFIHCADVHGQLALPVKAQLTASGICQGGAWGAPLGCPCRSSVKRPRGLGSISSSGAGQLCLGEPEGPCFVSGDILLSQLRWSCLHRGGVGDPWPSRITLEFGHLRLYGMDVGAFWRTGKHYHPCVITIMTKGTVCKGNSSCSCDQAPVSSK